MNDRFYFWISEVFVFINHYMTTPNNQKSDKMHDPALNLDM